MNTARTYVRSLTAAERQALARGRKSADAFTVRRSQILLASADGLGCLTAKSHARKDPGRVWDRSRDEDLKDLLHRRPRGFGKPTSLWTLGLVAEVCHEKGWTPRVLSIEAVRQALKRLGVGWRRAKHWITSPDPQYAKKKRPGTG